MHPRPPIFYVVLRIPLAAAVLVWLVGVGGGMSALWQYKNTPGAPARAPSDWPAGSRLDRPAGKPTLVMLAHPHCPCTRASVRELAQIVARAPEPIATYVLFLKPAEMPDGWERTGLWSSAASIPGATVVTDVDGSEAAVFGASVSGQTLLYDETGRLVFRGGITGARGHEGDNAGRRRVAALLSGGEADLRESPVFGCALRVATTVGAR
jgi:hypothetical protein